MAGTVIGVFGPLASVQSAARATLWIDGLMLIGALLLVASSIGSTYVIVTIRAQCCSRSSRRMSVLSLNDDGVACAVHVYAAPSWLFSLGSSGGVAWSVLCGIGIFSGYVPIGAMCVPNPPRYQNHMDFNAMTSDDSKRAICASGTMTGWSAH